MSVDFSSSFGAVRDTALPHLVRRYPPPPTRGLTLHDSAYQHLFACLLMQNGALSPAVPLSDADLARAAAIQLLDPTGFSEIAAEFDTRGGTSTVAPQGHEGRRTMTPRDRLALPFRDGPSGSRSQSG